MGISPNFLISEINKLEKIKALRSELVATQQPTDVAKAKRDRALYTKWMDGYIQFLQQEAVQAAHGADPEAVHQQQEGAG